MTILVCYRIFKFRKIISNRNTCQHLVSSDHPVYIDRKVEQTEHYKLYEGHFWSPLVDYLHDLVPKESHRAHFQLIVPTKWPSDYLRPLCIQLAGTGDHVRNKKCVLFKCTVNNFSVFFYLTELLEATQLYGQTAD